MVDRKAQNAVGPGTVAYNIGYLFLGDALVANLLRID